MKRFLDHDGADFLARATCSAPSLRPPLRLLNNPRRIRPPSSNPVGSPAMRDFQHYAPPAGLSVPLLTILDRDGRVSETDQRALVRYTLQNSRGADILFAAGTTGEWDKLDNRSRQR